MKTHKDVDFIVNDLVNRQKVFKTFDEAAGFAVAISVVSDKPVFLDVVIHTVSGARFYGGDDAVDQYREDPEASVYERIKIKAASEGMIP